MDKAIFLILNKWANTITLNAKRNAPSTEMAGSLRYSIIGQSVQWTLVDYGLYQNSGVRGSVRTIAKVGKAQEEAIGLGLASHKYAYTTLRPPTIPRTKLTYGAATEIFITGFPSSKAVGFRWLNKAFKNAEQNLTKMIEEYFEHKFDE